MAVRRLSRRGLELLLVAAVTASCAGGGLPSTSVDLRVTDSGQAPDLGGACKAIADCPAGMDCCAGVCTQTDSDPVNCGGCGSACLPGAVYDGCAERWLPACMTGHCTWSECGHYPRADCGCSPTLVDCVDLSSDAGHCGKCGHACPRGQECLSGECR